MNEDRIIIFDTTLRDGEQSPGASLNTSEKYEIAKSLVQLNVDVIEAGFPISSPGDFEAVKNIAETIKGPVICALARCIKADIDAASEALKNCQKGRIHVFLATSEIHRKFKLRKAREEILKLAVEGVKYAKSFVDDIEFSPEDASRTEPDFLAEVVEAAIDAGATTINIPDTVGYAVPEQFAGVIRYLKENVKNIDKCVISVHCHNDLGLAVANSLAAVRAGARQVECTINGLGERAGNCSLEEIVMGLKTRKDYFAIDTAINTQKIYPTSRLVSSLTGIYVQRNKAIVGENAFAHEAGIHQDGIMKERTTYEIMRAEDIGLVKSEMVLGKHSGKHAFSAKLKELGYEVSDEVLMKLFEQFKKLADKKKSIYEEDLVALVEEQTSQVPEIFQLVSLGISSGTNVTPTATVELKDKDGIISKDAACGDGPVDAIYKTVDRITKMKGKLKDYSIRAITVGKDAQGEVNLEVEIAGNTYRGRAASTDILEASAKAYLNAANKAAAGTVVKKSKGPRL